jgi:hypothetical protein
MEGLRSPPGSGIPVHSLRLEVVSGPNTGSVLAERADALTVGSAEGNDLILTDPAVSRFHLEVARSEIACE